MDIFNRQTKKKHIQQFEMKIAELLESELPQLKKVMNLSLSQFYEIQFTHNPVGISILRGFDTEVFEDIKRNHRTYFNLSGIAVFDHKAKAYHPIKLTYNYDSLTYIDIENPEMFHKTFDLNNIQKNNIVIEHLKIENPDQKIAEKALSSLTKEQLELLELEYTFEIEFEGKLYYTILYMEDGNYIAVDKTGKIYRLHHDNLERIKLIAANPTEFFKIFKGQKSNLEAIMNE